MSDVGRVLVVGGINHDVFVEVGRRPDGGETVVGRGPRHSSGGKGANQAVAAAAAGADVWLCAAVGDDTLAAVELEALRGAGVHVDAVRTVAGESTGTALIVVTPDGENSIVVGPGANAVLAADDVAGAWRHATPEVVLAQSEPGPRPFAAAAAAARAVDVRLVLNPAPVASAAVEVLGSGDPVVVNEHEAADLLGEASDDDPSAVARRLREHLGARSVVVSFGARGAVVSDADGETLVESPTVDAVDTTGSGDVLTGVLAARLAQGWTLVDATRDGCRLASHAATLPGARPLARA